MKDIALDSDSDILLDDGGSGSTLTGAAALRQRIMIRLRTEQGTFFYDESLGVPWLSKILGKTPDAAVLHSLFADAILSAPGVTGYERAPDFSFDKKTRIMSASFRVRYSEGNESGVLDVEAVF